MWASTYAINTEAVKRARSTLGLSSLEEDNIDDEKDVVSDNVQATAEAADLDGIAAGSTSGKKDFQSIDDKERSSAKRCAVGTVRSRLRRRRGRG